MGWAKLLSGRFLLTISAGIVFIYCSVKGLLKTDVIASIITMVFTLYFQRSDRSQNGNK